MIQSENITELLIALVAVQSELPTMPKNTPAYGYKYADLDTITQTIKPILHKHGIAYLQSIGGLSQELMTLTTRVFNTKGQYIEDTAVLPVITSTKNNAAQTLGMSITYMRRYALCAMLGITSDEDVDANTESVPQKQPHNSKKQTGQTSQQEERQPTQQPQKKAPNAAPTQKQQAASQGFTLKGGEATAAEREQLDELFHSKHADGTPIFTMQDIKDFSDMRVQYTVKELIDIVYDGYTQRLAEGPKGVPEDLF
ncbi:MAG: ERF family protein [Treponema sp.]|uniref:ERF family protein n=1 Tax=Treponema sp. TaxID=166 RepID=UPI003FA1CFC2